jgi:microcystin-dependent protein
LPVSSGTDLFFVIGTLFGGDGANDFALPDMTGMTAYGAGQVGGTTLNVGAKVGGTVPGIALNYLISLDGTYPAAGGVFGPNDVLLGQVIAYAGLDAPKGWAFCDGTLLPIASHKPLFNLIGTQFDGDGSTTLACPTCAVAASSGDSNYYAEPKTRANIVSTCLK